MRGDHFIFRNWYICGPKSQIPGFACFDESGNFLDIAWYPERDLNPHSLAAEGF